MDHREGKEAQSITVFALVDCHFLFPQNEREKEKEVGEIRLVLQIMYKYVF
jgi:hypothetical protein